VGRLPTLFHSSICSRTEELDLRRWLRAIHPSSRRPRAACRFLQSKRIASTTARSIEPRTPRRSRLQRSSHCGWPSPLSEISQPRFHGPGTGMVTHARLLPTAIARGRSFTPTRLARAPPVASLLPPGAGEASAGDEPQLRYIHRLAGRDLALAKPRLEGPPHAPSREGERIPPHPRCLPSMGLPPKGCALARPVLCFQSAVEQRAGAFSFTAHSPAFDQARDHDDSGTHGNS